jgi:hypothetical protein
MTTIVHSIDMFSVGLLLGLFLSIPAFASTKVAVAVLTSVAGSCLGFTVVNGFAAFRVALEGLLTAMSSDGMLIGGLLTGVLIGGVTTAIARN